MINTHCKFFYWIRNNIMPIIELFWDKDLFPLKYRVERFFSDIKFKLLTPNKEVNYFLQRADKGWAKRDTWNFDNYLSKVIKDGLRYLKKTMHGYPSNLTEKQWNKVLDNIIWTFDIANKISEGDIIYLNCKEEEYTKLRNKLIRGYDKKKLHTKVLTKREYKEFKLGFDLFEKYFFNLWN